MTLAGGVTLVGFGVLTGATALSVLGLVFMVWSLFSWIQDLRRAV